MILLYYIFTLFTLFLTSLAEIAILDSGIGEIADGDIAIIFFVTVKNVCKDELEISVNMVKCCEILTSEETDCEHMTLIGGDMGKLYSTYTRNLTLIYPNLYLLNRRGVCTVSVTYRNQFKKKEVLADISFDTTKNCPEKGRCSTIDMDSKQNCNPVDCLIKYSGMISFFDPECSRCKKVPICNSKAEDGIPDTGYSPFTNECADLNVPISKKDLEEIKNENVCNNHTPMINAICHYGTVTKSGECLCHDGWATYTNDEGMYEPSVAQQHLCNIQIGDWNCVNKNRIRITSILIAVFAITIVSKVLLLMCIMTWCYKHFRKPDKTCAKDLDSDDKSIMLCDESEFFSKCLCDPDAETEEHHDQGDKQQKNKNLQSQTVNVSYFPCLPNTYSSIKGSSGSSKVTVKTEQTINLSGTTASSATISFPEGDSSEESENTDQESFYIEDEKSASNDIAYGVYCGMEDINDEDIEEEILEEVEEEEEEEEEEDEGEENKNSESKQVRNNMSCIEE